MQLGAKVLAMSDSTSAIYDPNGIDLDAVRFIKEGHRGRMHEYVDGHKSAKEMKPHDIWSIPCDVALPCATQFEIDMDSARILIKNHVLSVCEGSNMSTTPEAAMLLMKNHIGYAPGKASNAGGVTVSGFEMMQNKAHEHWTKEKVDGLLKETMGRIYNESESLATSKEERFDTVRLVNEEAFLILEKKLR